ncbi:hypothetical protein DPSP01_004069 [Paraphaeosphaeria sporulosa]
MSDTNANFGATHDEPSVVMDIDPPDMTTHQPEAIHNQSEGFAPNVADSVMGTPIPDVAANASTTEVHGLVPVSDETTEPVVLPQDTEWIEDHAYQVVTVSDSIQTLFASYAKSFPAPSKIGEAI